MTRAASRGRGAVALRTERLRLTPLVEADLDAVHAIYGDPGTWLHLPDGRHRDLATTAAMLERSMVSWRTAGVGSWVVRRSEAEARRIGTSPDEVIGTAAATALDSGLLNLGYRFVPSAWGSGYASEAAAAVLDAAGSSAPDRAVTARVLIGNPASIRVLDRLGLVLRWSGGDAELDPTASGDAQGMQALARRIYADRPLDDEQLRALIALG
ncbi:GNAT family N-acetyltransferase [Agromyces lapidis]|uniref:GNAT family N-acetyltransferase n=1 Tax=Agromyces lapidis TaxID=279574 RepID=A0ABV5SNW5_9MICO|nr:GNAT family N-acetyltransferase [Agromyces lapidis]